MDSKTQQELMELLEEICAELGWEIAVPTEGPGEPAKGLILGEPEFLSAVLRAFGVDYESYKSEDGEIAESSTVDNLIEKKKQTLH